MRESCARWSGHLTGRKRFLELEDKALVTFGVPEGQRQEGLRAEASLLFTREADSLTLGPRSQSSHVLLGAQEIFLPAYLKPPHIMMFFY